MKFLFGDTKARYKDTLSKMSPARVAQAGESWENALLGFYFQDDATRARFSVRDTLIPLLDEDGRVPDEPRIKLLLSSITLELSAGDAVSRIHDAYSGSQPKG